MGVVDIKRSWAGVVPVLVLMAVCVAPAAAAVSDLTLFAVTSGNTLLRFSGYAPGLILASTPIGLQPGESILGCVSELPQHRGHYRAAGGAGDPDVHTVRSLRDQAARYADAAALRGQQWVAEWLKQVGR
jgi:hypothetical protein